MAYHFRVDCSCCDNLIKFITFVQRTLHNNRRVLASAQERVEQLEKETAIYKFQIERAKRENKLAFDREKFNKQRS